jgi:DNA-binding XRE family transcriptional regulator
VKRVCNRDCFNCPFPDCVLETLEAEDYRMQREAAELLKTPEQKKIAAKKRAYYEANRDEIAAKQRAYYEANRDEIAAKKGRLLYDFRHEHGMTQTALGKFLGGLSQPIISLYETGAVPIPEHILEACGLASVQAVSS